MSRALAAEAAETHGADPAATSSPGPTPSVTRSHQARPSQGPPETEPSPSARASRSRPASSPAAQATATAVPTSAVLSSPGGTVVADCRPGGAYLVSWSPAPGYEAGTVRRGPAADRAGDLQLRRELGDHAGVLLDRGTHRQHTSAVPGAGAATMGAAGATTEARRRESG